MATLTFGLQSGDLAQVVNTIAQSFRVSFHERDSEYWGTHFFAPVTDGDGIRVFSNWDESENEPIRSPGNLAIMIDLLYIPDRSAREMEKKVLECLPGAIRVQ
jgi:hypothetical protein